LVDFIFEKNVRPGFHRAFCFAKRGPTKKARLDAGPLLFFA
jgi:hypothetical protein